MTTTKERLDKQFMWELPDRVQEDLLAFIASEKELVREEEREEIQHKIEGLLSMQWLLKDGTVTEPNLSRRKVIEIFTGHPQEQEEGKITKQ